MPVLPIIIVNYNGGAVLQRCVDQVLASSLSTEIIIVDNASSDDSLSVLSPHPQVNIVRQSQNLGFAAAVNIGLKLVSQQDYVLVLNPDCFIETTTLAECVNLLDQHSQVGMLGVQVCNMDGSEQAGSRRGIPTPDRALMRVLYLHKIFPKTGFEQHAQALPRQAIEVEAISGAFMFIRQAALQDVGEMDERYFLHCEDLDWFMRFRLAGWSLLFSPHIRVKHIKGACSQAQPVRILWYKHRGMLRFYHKFFRQHYPAPLLWAVSIAVWSRFALLAVIIRLRHYLNKS